MWWCPAPGAVGVASIGVNGGNTRQIQVIVDPNKMQDYGLSVTSIVSALQADNMQGDAGLINKGDQQIDLHVNGQFLTPGDVLQVPVKLPSGQSIQISDVAQVEDAYADTTEYAYYNGVPCVTLNVMQVTGGNTVQIASEIVKLLPTINRSLPAGSEADRCQQPGHLYPGVHQYGVTTSMLGAIFSLIVLWLFLRRVRTTAVIAVVLPISVISTFAAMYFAGQTINTITLGGLALGLGSLVDFAVVVIESIARHTRPGRGPSRRPRWERPRWARRCWPAPCARSACSPRSSLPRDWRPRSSCPWPWPWCFPTWRPWWGR